MRFRFDQDFISTTSLSLGRRIHRTKKGRRRTSGCIDPRTSQSSLLVTFAHRNDQVLVCRHQKTSRKYTIKYIIKSSRNSVHTVAIKSGQSYGLKRTSDFQEFGQDFQSTKGRLRLVTRTAPWDYSLERNRKGNLRHPKRR